MMLKKLSILLILLTVSLLPAQDQPLTVRFVRHGQPGVGGTIFTPEDKAAWIGLGLTPLGRRQAETTGNFLKKEGIEWQQVIASPQERASETADIICSILGKTFTLDPDLREVGNPIRETVPGLRKRFRRLSPEENLSLTPAQSRGFKETTKACGERGRKFIMKQIRNQVRGPILLVAHGHLIFATILEMTGKRILPWNCGMSELKVWPDGKAELVKGVYPEVLEQSLITDNANYFDKNPWYPKFLSYPGTRPEDADFVNREFRLLLDGKNSSWKPIRRGKGKISRKTGESITLQAAEYSSPVFPLKSGKEYRIEVNASGKGTGKILLAKSPYHLDFTPDQAGGKYELKFRTPKGKNKFYTIQLTAGPDSEITVTNLKILPVEQ